MYLSLVLFFACVPQESSPQAELARDVASWIKRAGTEPPESLRDGPVQDYWLWDIGLPGNLVKNMVQAQKSGAPISSLKTLAQKLVGKFGSNPTYDFRLFFGLDHVLNPTNNVLDRSLQELFAEVQVEDWLLHPEKVERTAWFMAWVNEGKLPVFNFEGGKWREIRLTMLLACMMSSQDIYLGKTPIEVLNNRPVLEARLEAAAQENRVSQSGYAPALVIHPKDTQAGSLTRSVPLKLRFVPPTPFPDWQGLHVPVSPKVFREPR